MIRAKTPASIERANQIMEILRARSACNSQIAKELGISTALAQQYTTPLRDLGRIFIQETIRAGGRVTYMWAAKQDAAVEFFWGPKKPLALVGAERPKGLTSWVGGNPYDRLAA